MTHDGSAKNEGDLQAPRLPSLLVGGAAVIAAYVGLMSVLAERAPKAPDLLQVIVSPAEAEAPGPLTGAERGRLCRCIPASRRAAVR